MLALLAVEAITAGLAAYGTIRCIRLQRFAADRRLSALAWFFGLFALAVLLNAVWQLDGGVTAGWPGAGHGFPTSTGGVPTGPANTTYLPPRPHRDVFSPEGAERVNLWLTGHHALMLSAFVVGVWAFGHRRRATPPASPPIAPALLTSPMMALPAIMAAFAAVGDLVPAMLALEAGLALYLAARAFLNHIEVRSPGAVQVALGFALFFVGHLLFYVSHQPGYGHNPLGDILDLVGVALLVQALPGKSG